MAGKKVGYARTTVTRLEEEGQPLLRIEKIDHVRVTVAVPEANVGAINEGAPVEFTVSTWPGEKFNGTWWNGVAYRKEAE